MPADRKVSVEFTATSDTAGADRLAAAISKVEQAAVKSQAALNPWTTTIGLAAERNLKAAAAAEVASARIKQWTVTTNGAADAAHRMAGASRNSGQALMVFGQMVEDAQYSVAAAANQFGQFAMTMGLGAGIAGVVTLAGVGLSMLAKHVDLTGSKAAEAAKKSADLSEEIRKAAVDAEAAADAAAEGAKSWEEHAEAVAKARREYESLRGAIDEAEKARAKLEAAAGRRDAAEEKKALAGVDVDEAAGRLTKEQAEDRRAEIKGQYAARRGEREDEAAVTGINAARARAALLRAEAAQDDRRRRDAELRARRLLSPEQKNSMEKELERLADEDKTAGPELDSAEAALAGKIQAGKPGWNMQREREEVNRLRAAKAAREARRKQIGMMFSDDDLENRSGPYKSREEAGRAAAEAGQSAAQKAAEAQKLDAGVETDRRVLFMDRDARRMEEEATGISSYAKRQAAARAANAAADASRQKAMARAQSEFGDVRNAGEKAGVNPAGMRQLEAAFAGMMTGDQQKADLFMQLLDLLQPRLGNLRKEVDEMKAAVSALRGGH